MTTESYYSDAGPTCVCGGTIYGYTVERDSCVIVVRCWSCHRVSEFRAEVEPTTAAECSAAHRATAKL